MRTLDAASIAEKNKSANRPIFLYKLLDYDGAGTNLLLAEYDANVVFDGETYTKFPVTHDCVGENTDGGIDTLQLTVSNVSREIQAYLEANDLRGVKVRIRMVWANQLADAAAYIDDFFYIDRYTAGEQAVEFTLTSKFDLLAVEIPCRRYSRNYCCWRFKGAECAYAGAVTTCNKTFMACRDLLNQERFGGFPSIPMRRMVGL